MNVRVKIVVSGSCLLVVEDGNGDKVDDVHDGKMHHQAAEAGEMR